MPETAQRQITRFCYPLGTLVRWRDGAGHQALRYRVTQQRVTYRMEAAALVEYGLAQLLDPALEEARYCIRGGETRLSAAPTADNPQWAREDDIMQERR